MTKGTGPILACSILIAAGLAFVGPAGAAAKGDPAAGKAIFSSKCAACHGQKAEKNFGKGIDAEWAKIIKDGGAKHKKSPMMPAFGTLKDAEIQNVIAYIRSLKK